MTGEFHSLIQVVPILSLNLPPPPGFPVCPTMKRSAEGHRARSSRMHSPCVNHSKSHTPRTYSQEHQHRNCLIDFIFPSFSWWKWLWALQLQMCPLRGPLLVYGLEIFSDVLPNSPTNQKHVTELETFQSRQRLAPLQCRIFQLSGKKRLLSQNSLVLGLPSSEMTHRVPVVTKSFPARVTSRLLIWRTEKEKSSSIVRRTQTLKSDKAGTACQFQSLLALWPLSRYLISRSPSFLLWK